MRKFILLLAAVFVLLYVVSLVQAQDNFYDLRAHERLAESRRLSTVVIGVSPYRNPYYQPNRNYEPVKIGEPTWVHNEFSGKMGKPPRPFTDIMMKGTYRVHPSKIANKRAAPDRD